MTARSFPVGQDADARDKQPVNPDFQHAALAVPYCDALFCDDPMAHVLRSKPLEFGKTYQTTMLSRPEEILQYLHGLEQNSPALPNENRTT
jgi:hypothetical protein